MAAYRGYLRELVTAKAAERGDDYCSALLAIHDEDPDALTHEEVASILFSLSFAGHETTNYLIGNLVRRLLEDRSRWEAVVADPALIPGAVDETLRYDTSVPVWRRVTKRPVTLGGVALPEGAKLFLWLAATGRDPAVFPEPDRFDPGRENARHHLAFGKGIHYCAGASLGKLEARLAVEGLATRFPGLRLVDGQQIPFHPNISFRGPLELWVDRGSRLRPCLPPTRMARGRPRCSARRSARTSTARSRGSATTMRSCRCIRTSATPTPSWARPSTGSRARCSRPASRPGDRLGIWSPNCAEWVLVQYATARAGIVLVNINPAYRTSELSYVLAQSGCRALVAARAFKSSDYAAMIDEVRGDLPALEQVVYLGSDEWEALMAGADAELPVRTQFDEAINIQYTSGTTGFPKGATLSHHNILNNGFFIGEGCGYSERDRVCIPVPYYHCFGMVLGNLACTTHGACMVIPAPAFDPVATLAAVEAERCTSLYGVPTMFIAELEHERFGEFDLSTLRTGIMAGSPCPIETMRRVVSEMHMEEVTICYGMTETSPVSTQTAAGDPLAKRVSTVGRVHPHVEVKVIDPETGAIVPRGERGELCTRGYSVMLAYWDDAERTAEVIDAARWMHTGDLATMDDEGYVNIVGRIKDMVIRGGENLYPREIEEFLMGHPDVADVQVVGVPDPRYGEELMAWIVPRGGAAPDAEAIAAFCRGKIDHHKIPRYVSCVDAFPMTVTGKVQKYKLRDRAIEELGPGRGPDRLSAVTRSRPACPPPTPGSCRSPRRRPGRRCPARR